MFTKNNLEWLFTFLISFRLYVRLKPMIMSIAINASPKQMDINKRKAFFSSFGVMEDCFFLFLLFPIAKYVLK